MHHLSSHVALSGIFMPVSVLPLSVFWCRSVGRGGQSHYGRGPCGPGPKDDDAGTPDCQSGERYHPHPMAGRDGDS